MSSSRPQPLQSLPSPGAQTSRLGAASYCLLQQPRTTQAAAGGGRKKKIVDGLNRRRTHTCTLRAERRTEILCAAVGLDARPKGEGTIFQSDRGPDWNIAK